MNLRVPGSCSDFPLPIGKCLNDTILEVRDEYGASLQEGRGYVYIGSLSRVCYLNEENPADLENTNSPVMRCSGDVVDIDKNGHIYYVGRVDDQIKFNGIKVSLSYIENQVSSSFTSSSVIWDSDNLQVIIVCVEKPNVITKKEEIVSLIVPLLCPIDLFVVQDLPLTCHGKIDKRKLLLEYQKANVRTHLQSASPTKSFRTLSTFFTERWKDLSGCHEIKHSDNFILIGGDSIRAVQLANETERKMQRTLPDLLEIILNGSFEESIRHISCPNSKKINGEICHSTSNDQTEAVSSPKKIKLKNNLCFQTISRHGIYVHCQEKELSGAAVSSFERCPHLNPEVANFKLEQLSIAVEWRYDFKKCIDASVLVVRSSQHCLAYIGSHSGIFAALDLQSKQCLWKVKIPGRIESSACVSSCGNFIFFGSYNHIFYCLESTAGSIIWEFKTDGEIKSSPCIHPNNLVIYFGSHDHNVYALQLKTGTLKWKQNPSKSIMFASPAVSTTMNYLIVASLNGFLSALSLENGQIYWQYLIGHPMFSSPKCNEMGIYIGCVDHFLYCISFSGKLIWKYQTDGCIFSSPFLYDSNHDGFKKLLIGSHDKHVYCLNSKEGLLIWKQEMKEAIYSTPFVHNHVVVASDTSGNISLLSVMTGKTEVNYSLSGPIFSSPVFVNNKIVVGCRDNYIYCLTVNEQ